MVDGLWEYPRMQNGKRLTELEISAKLRAKKPFIVQTATERFHVLRAAKYLGASVQTKKRKEGGFGVTFSL